MALDDDIRILSGVTLFEGFTPDQLRLLAFGAERLRLDAGHVLFRAGDSADCAYAVASGRVALFSEGQRKASGEAREGAMLGEFALIADTTRPVSAVTATPCALLRLEQRDFRRILDEYPELAERLQKRVADDLQAMIARIERLAPRFS
ncbi:MAG: cyclic nucleotide-binding protein [Mesorhizobium amorphae]|nr:MAG: cyclic nucleotide-binding protein [Mesorhizobium amorphae]